MYLQWSMIFLIGLYVKPHNPDDPTTNMVAQSQMKQEAHRPHRSPE